MHIIYDDFYLKHDAGPSHIENPARLKFIIEEINNFRYREKLNFVEPFEASQKQVAALHDISYINEVKRLSAEGGYHYLDLDTIVSENTFKCAMLAAGGCFKGIDLILGGNHINYMKQKSEATSGISNQFEKKFRADYFYAIIRPPGHHAFRNHGSGFCIFNNIALSAVYAQNNYGANKIAIIDFDAHHGNGTQDLFYRDGSIFYISLHQYPHYPGTGYYDEIGEGSGKGFNLNLPLASGSGLGDYMVAFIDIIIPVLERFEPEVLLASAGYDGHVEDPLSSMNLTNESFYKIMSSVIFSGKISKCNKIGIILEGGYNHEATSESVLKTISACIFESELDCINNINEFKKHIQKDNPECYSKIKEENKTNFENIKKLFKI